MLSTSIPARKGHCLTNGHVVAAALKAGANLTVNSDAHSPGDLIARETAARVARGAGLSERAVAGMYREAERLATRLAART